MRYRELVESVRNFEDSFWFGEYMYFKALEMLKEVRVDLGRLELERHVKQIIKMFLAQWGRMGRTVDRKDLDWKQLTEQLRNSKESFQKLQGKTFLDINLEDKEIADAIIKCYSSAKVDYIGATAISKILHLLNPELFVMWDDDIRRKYKVAGGAKGYLEFLKLVKREVEEAIEEEAKKSGCNKKEIVERICRELPSNKLGREYGRKTLAKLIDEYNWWVVHYGV
ncbi:MAG: hypothetical protein QW291_03365 [Thermofilaceae archaeon]